MNTLKPLRIACIGCGSRAQTYTTLAARRPERFQIVAGADPVGARVEKVRHLSGRGDFRGFASAEAILAAGKIADVMIVATQDNDHFRHCRGPPGWLPRAAGEADLHECWAGAGDRGDCP